MSTSSRAYWDGVAGQYQATNRILCTDFHYGPLLPGDRELGLLPPVTDAMRCLELGCGGAQNSVYLVGRGAACTALDSSAVQLDYARRLACRQGVHVDFVQADMSVLPFRAGPRFELIHSTYALPFVADQRSCLLQAAELLVPGGTLLLTTAHPLSTAEWLEVDAEETGIFVHNGFRPDADRRRTRRGRRGAVVCRPALLSHIFQWLREAGLDVVDLREPAPFPAQDLADPAVQARVPYCSRDWLRQAPRLARLPFAAIFAARRPCSGSVAAPRAGS